MLWCGIRPHFNICSTAANYSAAGGTEPGNKKILIFLNFSQISFKLGLLELRDFENLTFLFFNLIE